MAYLEAEIATLTQKCEAIGIGDGAPIVSRKRSEVRGFCAVKTRRVMDYDDLLLSTFERLSRKFASVD